VPFWPGAAWRDVVVAVGVVFVIAGLAYFVGPPELGRAKRRTQLSFLCLREGSREIPA
jgi:hypothetical protein